MAEFDNTTSGIIWQWLAENRQNVLDYLATLMREASDIQLVNFDSERHMGLLATFVYQGVRRVDNVKPTSLVEGLTNLSDELRIRCENAAASAETQADHAKTQGDRVDEAISGYKALYDKVKAQGDTAEQQGADAQNIHDVVEAWFDPYKADAEDWIDTSKADFADWFEARQAAWTAWYTDGVVPDWNDFWDGVQTDWQDWTAKEQARQAAELERIGNELARMAEESVRKQAETERQAAELLRQRAEDARKAAEDERETKEALRQSTFEDNEAKRQEDFENAEKDRIAAMTVTHPYVDLRTMCLMFVQPASDSTEYKVRNGCLDITTRFEI